MTEETKPDLTNPDLYHHWATDVLRYCDTDQQGHINNVAFTVFCETGRVKFLLDPKDKLNPPGTFFVIARMVLNFLREIMWPGEVRIGTATLTIGRSSFTLVHGLFVDGTCVGTSESVIVLADETTRKSTPLTEAIRQRLTEAMLRP
ncbi:thioesterase [Paramagnetospirillum kuznetsovii]|uniref:Thioesterase n=1 Tax=Paramagnetospirillum kuznetsovii TaxID=2053833 RepID=A0A364P1B8_9PROT|nr:thioesterase family protein [Paramagnetospirillum kuznetsovii]RAU23132.1 thioesterase [Paramagnetospirillum kuznetsovii]